MDLANITDKAKGFVLNHGVALSFIASVYGRASEVDISNGTTPDPIATFVAWASNASAELGKSISTMDDLKWKLWASPHIPTSLFKVSIGVWIAGQLLGDYIPSYYVKLAGKAAVGSAFAALTTVGSEPYNRPPSWRQTLAQPPMRTAAPTNAPASLNYTIQG